MTVAKKSKKKRAAAKRERRERRFAPETTYASRVTTAAGMLGALALGAGVYAEWVRDQPRPFAPYLVAAGALVMGGALWRAGDEVRHVRVGDIGVALEKGGELVRLLWCDLERVSIDGGKLVARGKSTTISFPIDAHPKASAWLVTEAGRRVPDVVSASRAEIDKLGLPSEKDGELVTIEELQITGRHCRATDKPIAFERDARLCPTCCETYLKDHVPRSCATCGSELGDRAHAV